MSKFVTVVDPNVVDPLETVNPLLLDRPAADTGLENVPLVAVNALVFTVPNVDTPDTDKSPLLERPDDDTDPENIPDTPLSDPLDVTDVADISAELIDSKVDVPSTDKVPAIDVLPVDASTINLFSLTVIFPLAFKVPVFTLSVVTFVANADTRLFDEFTVDNISEILD